MHTGRIQTATWAHLRVHKSKGYENGCFSWIISYTIASFLLPEFCHIFLSILLLGGEPYCDLVKCFALTHNNTQLGQGSNPAPLIKSPVCFSFDHCTSHCFMLHDQYKKPTLTATLQCPALALGMESSYWSITTFSQAIVSRNQ